MQIKWRSESFKKIDNPVKGLTSQRYIFLANIDDVMKSDDILKWCETNPREQNTKTRVAKSIRESLKDEKNYRFHELNRGILFSADSVSYNNKNKEVTINFDNSKIHGNIDGGHTLKIIISEKDTFFKETKYVLVEVITGLNHSEIIDLAEARNTSVQVDRMSIEELKNEFQSFHEIFKEEKWYPRVKTKQNQIIGEEINMRTLISLFVMFNPEIVNNDSSIQPIFTYSTKETSLKKFIYWKEEIKEKSKNNSELKSFGDFIKTNGEFIVSIINLYEKLEKDIPISINSNGKKYGSFKFSKKDDHKNKTKFFGVNTKYNVPTGLIYPIINGFRANMTFDKHKRILGWKIDNDILWESVRKSVSQIIFEHLRQMGSNPTAIGKSSTIWEHIYFKIKLSVIDLSQNEK